ncbi:MAG: hypothetical protein ACPF9D_04725, partial [Owenweeksia sp.]
MKRSYHLIWALALSLACYTSKAQYDDFDPNKLIAGDVGFGPQIGTMKRSTNVCRNSVRPSSPNFLNCSGPSAAS